MTFEPVVIAAHHPADQKPHTAADRRLADPGMRGDVVTRVRVLTQPLIHRRHGADATPTSTTTRRCTMKYAALSALAVAAGLAAAGCASTTTTADTPAATTTTQPAASTPKAAKPAMTAGQKQALQSAH